MLFTCIAGVDGSVDPFGEHVYAGLGGGTVESGEFGECVFGAVDFFRGEEHLEEVEFVFGEGGEDIVVGVEVYGEELEDLFDVSLEEYNHLVVFVGKSYTSSLRSGGVDRGAEVGI